MSFDWKTYEEVVRKIYEALGRDSGVTIDCHGSSCKVLGKSNVSHQIDVLTSHTDGLHKYRTAIECKYWDQKVNKDIVMKVREIIEDASIDKGVIVTKKGFTPDAISFAEYRNIRLVELREPVDSDWEGRVKDISINLNLHFPTITKINFKADSEPTSLVRDRIEKYIISSKAGDKTIRHYADLFAIELFRQQEGVEYIKDFEFDEETILIDHETNFRLKVKGLRLGGLYNVKRIYDEVKGEDHVWLIMNSIFDKKLMTISRTGEIIFR